MINKRWGVAGLSVAMAFVSLRFLQERTHQAVRSIHITVSDEISCPACRIVGRRSAIIGDDDGLGALIGVPTYISSHPQIGYFVIGQPLPQIYDFTGKFIGRLGRKGSGPGEFSRIAVPLPISSDSTLVINGSEGVASVFNRERQFVRQIRLPLSFRTAKILTWPDSVIVAGSVQSRQAFGIPLHLVSFSGTTAAIVRSGGGEMEDVRPGSRTGFFILPSDIPELWSSNITRYQLSHWDRDFKLIKRLRRQTKWWPEQYSGVGTPTSPPSPVVVGAWIDSNGLIWVTIRAPGKNWKDAWPKNSAGREVAFREVNQNILHRTLIEVIDSRTGKLVASTSFNRYPITGLSGPKVALYSPTADDVPRVEMFELRLVK